MRKLSFLRGAHFGNIAGALFSALLCAASASAEVLVSEGCDTTSDYVGAKSIADNGVNLNTYFPKSFTASIGLAGSKWSGWGDKPKTYSVDLPLPGCFASAGLVSKGGACVGLARGSAATQHRWSYLKLAADKLKRPAGSTFYFRGLMNIDSKAAAALTKTSDAIASGNSFGFGLSTRLPSATTGDKGNPLFATNALGFYYWRDTSGTYNLSGLLTDCTGASVTVPVLSGLAAPSEENVTSGNTFICYAEVKVNVCVDGREVVRIGAVCVSDYNRAAVVWSDPVAVELVSDNDYPTDIFFTGDYCTNGCAMFDEFVVATALSEILDVEIPIGAPVLSGASLEASDGGFTASAALSNGAADDCGVLVFDGQTYTKLSAGPLAVDALVEKTFAAGDLPSEKTCAIFVYAENGVSATTNYVGYLYGGTPVIAKVSDADEEGRSPGSFTISRADAAFELVVNYSVLGSAASGVNYEPLSGSVTFRAGESSATVEVYPKVAAPHDSATDLIVAIASGNYGLPDPAPSATVAIANFAPPAGTNTWVAAADGLASDAANWSFGRVPVATDDILLDGTFSTANLTWDGATEGMTDTVKSWTQLASYTGVVTMDQRRTGEFARFTVEDDAVLSGGSWTHPSNGTENSKTAYVWLNVLVKGDLTTDSDFVFNADRKGYYKARGFSPSTQNGGAAHGGQGGPSSAGYGDTTSYGDYRLPTTLGSGGYSATGDVGGGAILIEVFGEFVHNGSATASGNDNGTNGAAGGAIYVRANELSGSGSFAAVGGGSSSSNNKGGGGGGRVAIYLTSESSTYEEFLTSFTGTLSAAGGDGKNTGKVHSPGAAGTVYVETSADNGKGHMIVAHSSAKLAAATKGWTIYGTAQICDGVTWDMADLAIKEHGRVGIVTGGTLRVPSFAKITGDGSEQTLLRFHGGSVTSDIRHDKLVADGFAVESAGTSSFADHTLVIPDDSSLKVSGDFTVGALIMGHTRLAKGEYPAETLAKTYSNVSGDGTISVLGLADALTIIVR